MAALCCCLLLLLARPSVAQAQEEFVEPQAKLLTTIPFTILTGGVIIVKARLDEFGDTLNFVFDTGSIVLVFTNKIVRIWNLKLFIISIALLCA